MRKYFLTCFVALSFFSKAQNLPQHINYQAIFRNQNGEELAPNTNAVISFSIYNAVSDPLTAPAYVENHAITIPQTKVVSLKIGQGIVSGAGSFSAINWSSGEVNYLVGINGIAVGNRQVFSSVPYALYSVNSGSTSSTYSFTNNFTNSSGTIDLSSTSVTAGTYGSNSTLNSRWSSVTLDNKGRVTSASDFPANIKGDIGGKLDSQYVSKLRNIPLSNATPTNGQIMQYNGSIWGPGNLPAGAQTTSIQAGNGISINGTAPSYTISSVSSGSIGAANGLTVVGTNPNFSIAPVTNATVGVWSTVGNSNTNGSNGFIGTTDSNPFIIRTSNTIRALFNGLNGNLGLGLMNPAYKLHSFTSNGAIPIYGENSGTANNPDAYGVFGTSSSSSTLSAGLYGRSLGNGSGVIGRTTGAGPAIIAQSNTITTSALSLLLENGHVKSVGPAPSHFSTAVQGGFTLPSFAPTVTGTDVKGTISFSTGVTGFSAINYIDCYTNFAKPYGIAPRVVITPTSDLFGLSYYVLNVSTTQFVVRVYRPNGAGFPTSIPSNTFFNFNYIVIE